MREIAIGSAGSPMRRNHGAFASRHQDTVKLIHEMHPLRSIFGIPKVLNEVAGMRLANGIVFPGPRFAEVRHEIHAWKSNGVCAFETVFLVRPTTKIQF